MSLIEADSILLLVSKIIIPKKVRKKVMDIKFQKDLGKFKFKKKMQDLILITDF
jgi:hypothetical protein